MRTILLSLAALMATPGLLLVPVSGADPATAQQTVSVEAGSDYFCDPSFFGAVCETTINAGDTVTWDNIQGAHTVTECSDDSHTECPPEGGFDSGIMTQGDTFSHTFANPGTTIYYCAVHPDTMQGRIVALQVTPTPVPTAAPTAAPTQPGSTPAPVTSTPVSVPSTGGPTGETSGATAALALALGGLMVAAAATTIAWSAAKR